MKTFNHISFILLALVAVVIAAATFVEDNLGTKYVSEIIYTAWWFRLLWVAVAVAGMVQMWRMRLFRRFTVCLLHVSFLVILAGALTTALTSKKGMMHLRQHVPSQLCMLQDGTVQQLPFVVELDTFYIDYYPGTEAHSGYTSRVKVGNVKRDEWSVKREEWSVKSEKVFDISMNHILKEQGWRLYQQSFDEDLQGSWLMATYDPWGIGITYVGYLLLALSAILLLLNKRESFVQLLHHPALKRGLMLVVLAAFMQGIHAKDTEVNEALPVVKVEQADALKREQVVYGDRVVPFNTVAIDFVQKLCGKKSFRGLTPEQVVVSWQLNPAPWRNVPIIRVKAKHQVLMQRLGLEGDYIRISDLYDPDGNYRLEELFMQEYGSHSVLEKAIQDIDERLGVVLMLEKGTLFKSLPKDGTVQPLSETKVNAELLYNAVPFTKILFMANLTLGFLLFFLLLWQLTHGKPLRTVFRISLLLLSLSFLFHTFGYCLRWYISGTVPLTNGYETMQFVALVTMLIALLLSLFTFRSSLFTLSGGFLISGFTLLVSYLGQMNPRITSLMPVLQSPWLSSHVSLIMISYSLFAFITLNAIVGIFLHFREKKSPTQQGAGEAVYVLSRLLLYPAVMLLAIGIFLGAVWANVSWGSYWSWDPKEAWALITMIAYGIAFHRQSLSWLRRPLFFHLYILFCFLTVLMTYFGVNYLLGGMHSYGG